MVDRTTVANSIFSQFLTWSCLTITTWLAGLDWACWEIPEGCGSSDPTAYWVFSAWVKNMIFSLHLGHFFPYQLCCKPVVVPHRLFLLPQSFPRHQTDGYRWSSSLSHRPIPIPPHFPVNLIYSCRYLEIVTMEKHEDRKNNDMRESILYHDNSYCYESCANTQFLKASAHRLRSQ